MKNEPLIADRNSSDTTAQDGWPTALLPRFSGLHLAYFLGVPLAVAVYAAINNWEIRNSAGLTTGVVFYASQALLPWWITCLCTTAAKRGLQKWKPAWPVLLVIGHSLSCMLVLPYSNWLMAVFDSYLNQLELAHEPIAFSSTSFAQYYLRAGIIWFLINFLFDRFLGLPLYRYEIPRGYEANSLSNTDFNSGSADDWPGRQPVFLTKLPISLAAKDVLAIKAEQHYIKIFTPDRNYMVLYRFSDAVQELDASLGHQVHRSYWVATHGIESVKTRAKAFYVTLTNGEKIPVSGPYQGMLRELARANNLQVVG